MRADDNKDFPGIEYIKALSIFNIYRIQTKYRQLNQEDFKNDKLGLMRYLYIR